VGLHILWKNEQKFHYIFDNKAFKIMLTPKSVNHINPLF